MHNTSKTSLALIALSTALTASAASASDVRSLKLKVGGMVEQSCSITAPSNNAHTVALDATGSDTMDFAVDCNVPIQVSLKAERGAFALDADKTPEHSTDYTSFVNYEAGFSLPIGSNTWTVSGQSGENLQTQKSFSPSSISQANTPPFNSTLVLALNWNSPTGDLLAGTYSEMITITVAGQ